VKWDLLDKQQNFKFNYVYWWTTVTAKMCVLPQEWITVVSSGACWMSAPNLHQQMTMDVVCTEIFSFFSLLPWWWRHHVPFKTLITTYQTIWCHDLDAAMKTKYYNLMMRLSRTLSLFICPQHWPNKACHNLDTDSSLI
jgi:hypothetical protein